MRIEVVEMAYQFCGNLILGLDHFLQANNFLYKHLVGLRQGKVLLLQLLHLMLGRCQCFA